MADQDPEAQPVDENQSNEQAEQGQNEAEHVEETPATAEGGDENSPQQEVVPDQTGGEESIAEQPEQNENNNAEEGQAAAEAEDGEKVEASSEQVEQTETVDEQGGKKEETEEGQAAAKADDGEKVEASSEQVEQSVDEQEDKKEEAPADGAENAGENAEGEQKEESPEQADQSENVEKAVEDAEAAGDGKPEQADQNENADKAAENADVAAEDSPEKIDQNENAEVAGDETKDQVDQDETAKTEEQDQVLDTAQEVEGGAEQPDQSENAQVTADPEENSVQENNAETVDKNDNNANEEGQEQGEAEAVAKEADAEAATQQEATAEEQREEDAAGGAQEMEEAPQSVAEDEAGVAKGPEEAPEPAVPEPMTTQSGGQPVDTKPMVNLEATATVKFVLMPSGQVVTLACTLGQTLESLKTHFAMELKMPSSLIMLMFDGKGMPDSTTLADLGVGPNGTVQLEMQSADPVNTPLKPYRPRQEYHMPDVITVRVMTEDCEAKDVVVEIERSRTKKPFLGGFRNKNTGVEFHNAAAQTMQKPRPPPTSERFCRDTQTCEQRNNRQQTTNTTSTQMTGVGVYVSNIEDKLITPGSYTSADEYWAMILSKVIILQKYYRRWLAKRYVKKLKEDKEKRLEWERQEEMRKKKEKEERIRKEYARRINPKTKADFDMLLHCLEKWRKEEMERINSTLTGAERKAAMCMLLDQETELLSAIERHKNEANIDNRDKKILAFLEKAAAPKKWQAYDGKLTYMDTPFTIRAKELRDIYNSINMKYLTQDERLDVLLTLKHTVKEHDCKLTQEIIELIDREADLLMRGVKESNLTGLRKRISTLFLQYIKTPTFNPEAARLLKVPQDPSTLRKNINYCHSCGSYLPSTEFFITSNTRNVSRCRNCIKIENDGQQREDHNYYRVMLRALRKSEEAMQDGSNICYLLQENDLRYLVENIWSNHSVLSAWNDLYDLVLCRWDKHQEWSPWNCILLTHDEAEAHKKLFSLEEGYGHVFIHKVTQKHNFARNYFSRLPGMAEALRQKLGSRELAQPKGPAVAGHSVAKAQKV